MKTELLDRLQTRLEGWGLAPLIPLVLEIAEPLSPFAAQTLWVLQPSLSLFIAPDQVGQWAHFLEDPEAIAHLKAHLSKDTADE